MRHPLSYHVVSDKKEEHCFCSTLLGAVRQILPADLVITNDALYRLSYNSIFCCFFVVSRNQLHYYNTGS